MNLNPSEKQNKPCDAFIPTHDPRILDELQGLPQSMVFPLDNPDPELAGKAKGMKVFIKEQGL